MTIFRPRRIRYRIILPFTLLFIVTTVFCWLFSVTFISRHLDLNMKRQMEQVVSIISRYGYALNPHVLRQMKQIINCEIILFDQQGQVINTTFDEINSPIEAPVIPDHILDSREPFVGKNIEYQAQRYRTVNHSIRLPGHGRALLSLWMPARDADHLKSRIILGIGAVTLLGIFAMTLAGYLIARSITAPVEGLVRVTEKVSTGDLTERAEIQSNDELGFLAESFNLMIEKLHHFEQRLVESEKLATAGQMAAGMAHEVRNPLTSIKMLWQVLQNRLKDAPENQKILASLVREIDRLDRIVQEMIDKTRSSAPVLSPGDLNAQVSEVIKVAEENLKAQHIVIEQDLKPLPPIYMDAQKIRQVLWNLLLNAKEAMPKGGTLSIATRETGHDQVEMTIDDSGPGLALPTSGHLFQPFFTTKPEGVGLGLFMSRKIIDNHGGSLTLENRPQGGARAEIKLPLKGNNPDDKDSRS